MVLEINNFLEIFFGDLKRIGFVSYLGLYFYLRYWILLTLSGWEGQIISPSYKKCHNFWKANDIGLKFYDFF